MKIIFTLLMFAFIASLTGALFLIIYRQKTIRALQGHKAKKFLKKVLAIPDYFREYIVRMNINLVKNNRYANIEKMLQKINLDDKISPEYFLFMEQSVFAAVLCLVAGLSGSWTAAVLIPVLAFFIPEIILRSKVRKKQDEMLREMPDAFDIIAANIEGGQSLNTAMARYSSRSKSVFALELLTVIRKTQFGKSFSDSLRELDEKFPVRELTGFVNAFIQAERSGGNIKEIIKGQAAEIRQKRFQYLKKRAHEAPVKLLLPLMLFIFPVIFIVLFAPIVIKLLQGF